MNLKQYASERQSQPLSRGACPKCGSSDARVKFSDKHYFCFSCETYTPPEGEEGSQYVKSTYKEDTTEWEYGPLTDRQIKEETARFFGVRIEKHGSDIVRHEYPYYDKEGNKIASKFRRVSDKDFKSEGRFQEACLFGQNKFTKGRKVLTITEGECDCMAAYELMGSQYPVVSIKSGGPSGLKGIKDNFEWVDSFETIVLAFDSDEVGQKSAAKVAALFEPKKCKIMKMKLKDPNEYLRTGQYKEFMKDFWAADIYTPAGIVNLADLSEELYSEDDSETCLYPWEGLNEKLFGMRTGELVTFTAGTGIGKSSILRELEYHILTSTEDNIGILALEENRKQTCFHVMSVAANERLYIKEVRNKYTREEMQKWEFETIGTRRLYAFDHFGSIGNDEILSRVRYMVKALDCKWIILDHLSILVSGQEEGDERRSIDILMTKLRSLVEETQCGMLLVSHLKRVGGDKGHENGAEVTLAQLRGSQAIAQLSDAVIAAERNQQADDPQEANTTRLRVLKNRYAGDNGLATYLLFNPETGRLTEVDPSEITSSETEGADDNEYADLYS